MGNRSRLMPTLGALLLATVVAAQETPPAPDMPDGWAVVSDDAFEAADIAPVSRKLGGEIAALRNTVYRVGGQRVQLNLIVAASPSSAGSIYDALVKLKPAEFVLRQGTRIYEFVGSNAAIPAMRAGRAHLERHPAPEAPARRSAPAWTTAAPVPTPSPPALASPSPTAAPREAGP